jgi:GTP-binding protein Era
VSPKANTTNAAITGVFTEDNVQLVFFDTPGILSEVNHTKMRNKTLVRESWETLQHADVVLVVVDAAKKLSFHDFFLLKDVSFPTLSKLGLMFSPDE